MPKSVYNLFNALVHEGYSDISAENHIACLTTHACVARTRTDASGAFRAFATIAGHHSRNDPWFRDMADGWVSDLVGDLACEALHDLIMEGV